MIITAFNPSVDNLERTYLAQSYPLNTTSVELKNNSQFPNNTRAMFGDMGLSETEIVTTGAPNANATTTPIGATLFGHSANTPIYNLLFDQVKFYRSTTGINGTYTLLATVNLDVTNPNLQTIYNDNQAQTSYYYKVSMFNSITTVESALSDPIPAVTGYKRNQVGYLIDQIYLELSDPNEENLTRGEIYGYLNEVNDDLLGSVAKPYKFLYTRTVLGRTGGRNYLPYPTDTSSNQLMWKFDRMDYNFVDNTVSPVTNVSYTVEVLDLPYYRNRFTDNTNNSTTQDDSIQAISLDDANDQFVYHPPSATTASAVFYLYYYAYFTQLQSEGDVFQTPTSRIYKLYVYYRYYLKRSATTTDYTTLAQEYYKQYLLEKARLKQHDRKDVGTPRRIESQGWTRKSFRR